MALPSPEAVFFFWNTIPLPHLLTKVFLELPFTNPIKVSMAFLHTMSNYDSILDHKKCNPILVIHSLLPIFIQGFYKTSSHYQFCHLCTNRKINPVLCTLEKPKDVSHTSKLPSEYQLNYHWNTSPPVTPSAISHGEFSRSVHKIFRKGKKSLMLMFKWMKHLIKISNEI